MLSEGLLLLDGVLFKKARRNSEENKRCEKFQVIIQEKDRKNDLKKFHGKVFLDFSFWI